MKRFALAVRRLTWPMPWWWPLLPLLSLLVFTVPAFASPPKTYPFTTSDEIYELSASFSKDAATDKWTNDAAIDWFHLITPRQAVGTRVGYFKTTDTSGSAFGGSYRFYLARLKYGAIGVGGDLSKLTGDASDAAQLAVATNAFYQLYFQSAALTFQIRLQHAVNPSEPGSGDAVNQAAFLIGFDLIKRQAVPAS